VPIDAGWTLILLVSLSFLLTEQLLLLVVHGSCCWFVVPTGSSVVPAELARDVVGNDLTTTAQLIGLIKNQLAAAPVPAA
ncbi:hypothetical protein Tco_0140919, partial [Tanacetum coccineum]